jgi:hypothetical protein
MHDNADQDARQPTQVTGKLTGFHGGHIDCEIRSIYEDGATVEIKVSRAVPSDVELWEDATCSIYTCKVSWQRGRLLGLRFIEPLAHDHARKRMLEHLNNCTSYALARVA